MPAPDIVTGNGLSAGVLRSVVNVAALPLDQAARNGERIALVDRRGNLSYEALGTALRVFAGSLEARGIARRERIAVWLDKRRETVIALFGTLYAGCVAVPINPSLKPRQVHHILHDCGAGILVTSTARLAQLRTAAEDCIRLPLCILVDDGHELQSDGPPNDGPQSEEQARSGPPSVIPWAELDLYQPSNAHRGIDADIAAIFYTSGSTGLPKGVVVSHRNLIAGASSVNDYLANTPEDRLLAALPLSFDAGFSQLTTGFAAGARVVLHNYLTPQGALRAMAEEGITALTGVPPLWMQLVRHSWPDAVRGRLRYLANTGGHMPRAVLEKLQMTAPRARIYLMYGLTEAFRSTYLPPEELERRPDSIGRAMPNTEIFVLRDDGSLCAPGEVGELVHRGATVALGYWNDAEITRQRFRPLPEALSTSAQERCVWSGDLVRMDEDGFLYFVGRNDDMIKVSGYRVSPTEIEEVLYRSGTVGETAVFGLPDAVTGQTIVAAVAPNQEQSSIAIDGLLEHCRIELPTYMVPSRIEPFASLPRSPNGKIDRTALRALLNRPTTDTALS